MQSTTEPKRQNGFRYTIIGPFVSFNSYINSERRNRFLGAKIKKEQMELMLWQLPTDKIKGRIDLTFQFYFKDKRRDPDSVMFTVKCFLDTLVLKGIIPNDTQQFINRIIFEPVRIAKEEKMIIEITAPSRD